MLRSPWVLLALALPFELLLACTPNVGDKCSLSTDCSQLGDRLCDTTQPNGYCTIFNCEPDQCPSSICVAFDPSVDPACGSDNGGRWPRFERSYCLAPCNQDSDCRGDYQCVDLDPNYRPAGYRDAGFNPNIVARSAEVVDLGAGDGGLGYSVCMINSNVQPPLSIGDGGVPPICMPPDAGFEQPAEGGAPWPAYDGGR
jgi:hypothetical protein